MLLLLSAEIEPPGLTSVDGNLACRLLRRDRGRFCIGRFFALPDPHDPLADSAANEFRGWIDAGDCDAAHVAARGQSTGIALADLCGRFDYLSLDRQPEEAVEFSILILHPELGAEIRAAVPPTR